MRASGIATGGGAAQSFVFYVVAVIGILLATVIRSSFYSFLYLAGSLAILLSTFFVGRTGLYLGILAIILCFFSFNWKTKLRFYFFSGTTCLVFAIFYFLGDFNFLESDNLDFYLSHSLELFNNYFESDSVSSETTDEVARMIYFPSAFHFVFGAGFLNDSSFGYYLPDPGIMKVLLMFGVFGFITFYSFSIYLALYFARSMKLLVGSGSLIIYFVVLSYFLYELKEPGLYQNYSFKIFILFAMSSVFFRLKSKSVFDFR